MKQLWNTSWTIFKITSTMQINSFISLLRKLPLLERLIPVSLYRRQRVKQFFALGGLVKGMIGSVLGRTLFCLLLLSWIPYWLGIGAGPKELLVLYIIVEGIAPMFNSCSIFRAGQEDYVFLNHFMMNPTDYYHYKIGKEILEDAVTKLPALWYLLGDVRLALTAVLADACFTLMGCCLHLFLYDRLHNMVKRRIRNCISYSMIIAAYFCLKKGWFSGCKMTPVICLGMLVVLVLCYCRLLHYKDYKRIAVQFANKEAMVVVNVSVGAEEGRDSLDKFPWEKNRAFYEKNKKADAAAYLNRAFFERFKELFVNQRRQIFILSILLGVLLGVLIRNGVLKVTGDNILNYTPMLIALVNSIMLFGQRFTTLCFRFLDMPMMYHQVCDREYLKKSIRCRYAFLVKHSLAALTGLALFISLVLLVSGIRISAWDFVFLLLSMELLMLIQELYQLLIYYWIQPYTVDVSVKSPVFKALGLIEGAFDIGVLFVRGNLALACLPLLGLFLLVNVLMLVMERKVHRTFRLRY